MDSKIESRCIVGVYNGYRVYPFCNKCQVFVFRQDLSTDPRVVASRLRHSTLATTAESGHPAIGAIAYKNTQIITSELPE